MRLNANSLSFDSIEDITQALAAIRRDLQARNKSHCRDSCACGPCLAARQVAQAQATLQPDLDEERRLWRASLAERSES